jgi:DNA-binding MarR family transcriptional regulator
MFPKTTTGHNKELLPVIKRRRRQVSPCPIPAKYRNRPATVRTAIKTVWLHAENLQFTRSEVKVFQAIIAAGVSMDEPYRPVFARKTTLATMAGVTTRTVFRSLDKFEKKGLITRHDQKRLEDGSMDISEISITSAFWSQLGINNDQQQSDGSNNNLLLPNTHSSDLPETVLSCELSRGAICKEQTVEQKASVNNQSPAPVPTVSTQNGFVRYQGRSVARELFWLIEENRLTLSGLFLLQKLAKKIGQRLSDFVQLRSERLRELHTAGDCFRYLKSLIQQNMDAAYLCSLQTRKRHQARRSEQKKQAAIQRNVELQPFADKCYVDPGSGQTYEILPNCQLAIITKPDAKPGDRWARVTVKLTTRIINCIRDGQWPLWKPPESTLEKGRRFMEQIHNRRHARCVV